MLQDNLEKLRKTNPFAFDENGKLLSLADQYKKAISDGMKERDFYILSPTLAALNFPNEGVFQRGYQLPLSLFGRVINKIYRKHGFVRIDTLRSDISHSPLFLESYTRPNAGVVILNQFENMNKIFFATVHLGKTRPDFVINEITSIYNKHNFQNFLENTISKGKKVWSTPFTESWLRRVGVQFPLHLNQQDNITKPTEINQINQQSTLSNSTQKKKLPPKHKKLKGPRR
jgi:hypothetical protein